MHRRLFALALALSVLGLPAAAPATAAGIESDTAVDAVIFVAESDLSALLDSGALGEYSLVRAADLGLDEAALIAGMRFDEDTVLTPEALGLDAPDQVVFGRFGGFRPFFTGFRAVNFRFFPGVVTTLGVPNFVFRPVPFFRPAFFPPVFRPFFPFTRVIIVPGWGWW